MTVAFQCPFYSSEMKCTFERARDILEAKLGYVFGVMKMGFALTIVNVLLEQNGLRSQYQSQIGSPYPRL